MATYDRLQPLSLHVNAFDEHPLAQYRTYTFPTSWARDLRREVFRSGQDEPDEPRGVPLWAVNNAIAALMPQVLTHDGTALADAVWLAWGTHTGGPAPDEQLLVEFVRGGLIAAAQARNIKAARRGRPPVIDIDALAGVVEGFHHRDLHHIDRMLRVGPGQPLDSAGYVLLPHALATHLVSTGWQVEHGSWNAEKTERILRGVSSWRRTAQRPEAELVSWPPHVYTSKNGTRYPWSYTLEITAQTLPLDPAPRIHIHLGIRRWSRTSVFDAGRAIGVHLFTPSPWSDASCPFGLAAMKWQPGPRGKKEGRMVWNDDLAPILQRLTSTAFLPDVADLAKNPLAYLEPDGENAPPLAGVPFRHGLGEHCKHSVGDGVSARDRWRIFTQLQPALAEFATACEPYRRITVKTRARPTASQLARIDRAHLAAAVGPKLEIALWCDTTVMRRELIEATCAALGLTWAPDALSETPDQIVEHHERTAALDLTVRVVPVGEIGSELNVDTTIKSAKDRAAKAAAERGALVTQRMHAPNAHDAARFAIIEMAGADSFRSTEHDPKRVVKAAASKIGVLTQNITPPKPTGIGDGKESTGTRTERARKAVSDLLIRQTGLLTPPDVLGTPETPLGDVASIGLWVVRRNSDSRAVLPLAVAWLPDQPYATIRLPHTEHWLPFHKGLLALGDWNTERVFTKTQVQDFFGQVVEEASDGSDTALLTLAQNIRTSCPGIGNGLLEADNLAFNPRQPIPVDRRKGLRHLRLRTNLRSETSQHYAYPAKNPDVIGLGSSLWADPGHPRRFFSTPDKPVTAGSGSPRGSRLEPHWGKVTKDSHGWKVDTLKDVWNPRLLEILVAVRQESDDAAAWAALVHQQRYAASHFADPLALPVVLHLASSVAEYILPRHQLESIQRVDG